MVVRHEHDLRRPFQIDLRDACEQRVDDVVHRIHVIVVQHDRGRCQELFEGLAPLLDDGGRKRGR